MDRLLLHAAKDQDAVAVQPVQGEQPAPAGQAVPTGIDNTIDLVEIIPAIDISLLYLRQ